MRRLIWGVAIVGLVGCAPTMGEPRPTNLPTVVLRATAETPASAAADALAEVNPRVALVLGPAEPDWFDSVAAAAGLRPTTEPGIIDSGLGVAFLGLEAVGDTTIQLEYDGGSFTLHDALYDLGRRRLLDLLAFRVETPAQARPLLTALAEYVATDVPPGAALVMAVAVPSPAVGDSVARLLAPMYDGAGRCGATQDAVAASEVLLFFGPGARIYCRSASARPTPGGDRIAAELVVGRRP